MAYINGEQTREAFSVELDLDQVRNDWRSARELSKTMTGQPGKSLTNYASVRTVLGLSPAPSPAPTHAPVLQRGISL
jgi:hypothetical protein